MTRPHNTTRPSLPLVALFLTSSPSLALAADNATEAALDGAEVFFALTLLIILSLLRWTDQRPQIPWRRLARTRPTPDDFSLGAYRASLGRDPLHGEVFSTGKRPQAAPQAPHDAHDNPDLEDPLPLPTL